ncbi:DUF1566 domain-containing protein [Desulfococcaceae bacterium HSG9]|nr:DUF1566 domain-containing protein [Desulfococcaceae bacterium HSG9]
MKRKIISILLLICMLIFSTAYEAIAKRGTVVRLKQSDSMNAPFAKEVELYTSSHALVIGIDAYTHWSRLTNAVKDAKHVAKVLEAMGFEVDLQKNLKSADLEKVLKSFFIRKGKNKNARLFVWFAGHGHTIDGEGFLVPADAASATDELLFMEKALAMRRFGSFMRFAKSKHVYAVFDSCFSGSIFHVARSRPPATITQVTTKPVRQYLSSGDAEQQVSDDGTFKELFINALQGEEPADANQDGYLTASELGMFLTYRLTNLTNSRQTPRYGKMQDQKYDKGDFVFVLPAETDMPSSGGVKFDDIITWGKWQQARDEEYQKAKEIDSSKYISSKGKTAVWKRFRSAVASDNPFSQDDEKMRAYAAKRVLHWQNVKAEKPVKTQKTDIKAKEINRDGRFIAYDDETVKDTKTGLIWAANDNEKDINWKDAKQYCENYTAGGYTDWRLPTIDELKGIYNSESSYMMDCAFDYKVYTTEFIHTSCWGVWTLDIRNTKAAIFDFNDGNGYLDSQFSSVGFRVLPVRGGKSKPDLKESTTKVQESNRDGRFIAYDNGTVKDTKTGLIWATEDNGKNIDWKDAKRYCKNYKNGGYIDWRLPTLDELEQLYDKAIEKKYKITQLITLTRCCAWTSDISGSEAAYYNFYYGYRIWIPQSQSTDRRVLPVRVGK